MKQGANREDDCLFISQSEDNQQCTVINNVEINKRDASSQRKTISYVNRREFCLIVQSGNNNVDRK